MGLTGHILPPHHGARWAHTLIPPWGSLGAYEAFPPEGRENCIYMLILRQENAAFWWKIFQSQSEIYRMRCKENSLSAPDSSFMRVKSFASVGIFSEKALT